MSPEQTHASGGFRSAAICSRRAWHAALACCLLALLAGCAAPATPDAPTPAPPVRAALPLDEAVASLTDALLAKAPPAPGERRGLVIDPLIDRAAEVQTEATRGIGRRMEDRVRSRHPEVELRPFNTASLANGPLILLGSIAGVEAAGSVRPAAGPPRVYRIWAAIADLRTGQVLGREMVWVRAEEVAPVPALFYRDSPVWAPDPVAAAYIRTCSSTAGTPIDPVYREALQAQALLADAIAAQEAGRHREALAGFSRALHLPGGEQLRGLNGLYLANWSLGRQGEAEAAFARLVEFGLRQDRLGVKLLFRPGSTAFWPDPAVSRPYPMWLRQIAARTEARGACLLVSGHASATGSAALNDRLSLARAEAVRARLAAHRPALRERLRAEGLGSRHTLVGTGTDDAADALDRRVEFRPVPCPALRTGLPETGRS